MWRGCSAGGWRPNACLHTCNADLGYPVIPDVARPMSRGRSVPETSVTNYSGNIGSGVGRGPVLEEMP